MTRDEIIQYLIDLQFVDKYTTKLNGYYDPDFIQEMYLQILEISEAKWELLQQQSNFSPVAFVSGVIYRNIKSANSPLYYKYKKNKSVEFTQDEKSWQSLTEKMASTQTSKLMM